MFKNRSFLVKLVSDKDAPETEDVVEEVVDVNKIKAHFQKYWFLYAVGIAGITCRIVRDVDSQRISPSVTGTAGPSVTGTGKSIAIQNVVSGKDNVLNNVSYISAHRKGPPSWVVRCKETNEIFTSQHAASLAKGISESNISKQLNGLQEHADGLHFERICLAA